MLYGPDLPFSGRADSREVETLTKKRELFPGLPSASPGSFALPHWASPEGGRSPCPGTGILTRFPFDRSGQTSIFTGAQRSERLSPMS